MSGTRTALRHSMSSLVLICGRPRAGKTTYSKRYADVLHLDSFGHIPNNYATLLEHLPQGDVVVDGIYNTPELRTELLQRFDGRKVCIWLDTPLEVIRGRYPKHIKLNNFPYPFEPPTMDEGWDEIIRTSGTSHSGS